MLESDRQMADLREGRLIVCVEDQPGDVVILVGDQRLRQDQ